MGPRADLHIHTLFSDGILSPEELFIKAKETGLSAICFTDHDTVGGCHLGHQLKTKYGLDFINGIEFSCYENGQEVHILGYNIDIDNSHLTTYLENFRQSRLQRAERILQKLRNKNMKLYLADIIIRAGEAPITRPHIAMAMVEKGYVRTIKEAFIKHLGDKGHAYFPKANFPVRSAIELINETGGLAVLAHPAQYFNQALLFRMINYGLDGIEVTHPLHNEKLHQYYSQLAKQYWLIETGGSDYHGSRDYDDGNFGNFTVPLSVIESIRYHGGKGRAAK